MLRPPLVESQAVLLDEALVFEQLEEPREPQPTDWSGTIIGLAVVPVFLVFVHLGRPDMGLTVTIALAMFLLAIKFHWKWRKRTWFWPTLAVVLACHIPLFFMIRWPHTRGPMILYTKPLGILDFFIVSGALRLADKLFGHDSDSQEDEA